MQYKDGGSSGNTAASLSGSGPPGGSAPQYQSNILNLKSNQGSNNLSSGAKHIVSVNAVTASSSANPSSDNKGNCILF